MEGAVSRVRVLSVSDECHFALGKVQSAVAFPGASCENVFAQIKLYFVLCRNGFTVKQ
jgi:hypothetical protein